MPLDVNQVQSVFLAAIEVSDPAQRRVALDHLCGDDSELRHRVEALLKAHDEPSELPGACMGIPGETEAPLSEYSPGLLISGRYHLIELIAEGGMGTVWVAQQLEPVRRLVALKLIKPGMDSRQVLSRFEAERQALALMDHPNIAKVFDGGLTDQGRPFFAMEYVNGVPITDYCDVHRLELHERLKLFVEVCQAVQHAHQKGIIHRDLKPSNVIVCEYEDQAVPKVIDFGLAKAMYQPLTEHTLNTNQGLMIGTPRYMSPEQAEFNNLDIDTRTDVYSLGVILYELFTGTTPLEERDFTGAALQEFLRLIKEEQPIKPSSKLRSTETLASIAALRKLAPVQLCRAVRGDLDWIAMKAIEKDRSRRYATASDLARDVDRYLRDEPVEAHGPSAGYRFYKLLRRNRIAIMTATLISTTMVAGSIVSTMQAIRATRAERTAEAAQANEAQQRTIAENQRNAANRARAAEAEQRKEAERRRWQAEANFQKAHGAVDEFFRSVSESKQLNDSALQPLRRELLEATLTYYEQLIDQYSDDPAVQPQMAEAYIRVGMLTADTLSSQERALAALKKGTELYERLARDAPAVESYQDGLAGAHHDLGALQRNMGRPADAEVSCRRELEIYERLAIDHPHEPRFQAALARALVNLGISKNATGHSADAEASLRRGLKIYEELGHKASEGNDYQWGLADAWYQLGHVQRLTDRLADAEVSYQRALDVDEKVAREHPGEREYVVGIARACYYLGNLRRMTGRWSDAQASFDRSLEIFDDLVRKSPSVASYRIGAARARFNSGILQSVTSRRELAVENWTKAAAHYSTAIELGFTTGQTFSELGDSLAMLGKWREAADAFEKALSLSRDDGNLQFQLALLQVAANELDRYRATCATLVRQHGDKARGSQAALMVAVCIAGEHASDDSATVLAISKRAAEADPRNPILQTLVGAAQYRACQLPAAIATLERSLPLHTLAEHAAPKQRDQIRATRLAGETILAMAYRSQRDTDQLAKQVQRLHSLIVEMASTPPQYSEGIGRWTIFAVVEIAKRELSRLIDDATSAELSTEIGAN
jgi:serine/threonine protein kinase